MTVTDMSLSLQTLMPKVSYTPQVRGMCERGFTTCYEGSLHSGGGVDGAEIIQE